MAKRKEQEKWVKYIDLRMAELTNDARDERKQWSEDVEEAFGFYNCDRHVIFQTALSKDARKDPDQPAQYHIPLLRQHVDSFVAGTTHNDIKIRYVPKIDQDQQDQLVDDVARMGNALFESYRTHISWDTKIHTLALHTALFGRGYMSLYINEVQDFPEPRADLRLLNAWQVYYTPGVTFDEATEVITECWIDRDELKAQYPELADEIDNVETAGVATKRTEEMRGDTSPTNRLPWDDLIPGYGDQNAVVSKNAVLVRERWKFDPTYETYSRGDSETEMAREHAMIQAAIDAEDVALLPTDADGRPDPTLSLGDAQYHDDHSVGHLLFIGELRAKMAELAPDMRNEVGVMAANPVMSAVKQGVAEAAIALLMGHEALHAELSEGMEEWKIGQYEKYAGGWRHSIVIGKGSDVMGVYDGYSKFYDYGIQGVPIVEFNVQPSPLNFWVNSYAALMVDENKLLNSFLNSARDNYAIFGNNQWWHEAGLDKQPGFHISTDPREPSTFPPGSRVNMPGGKAGIIPAIGIPGDAYNMIQLVLGLAQQTSGVFGSLRGQRQEGVRSGQHEQFLAQANRAQLDAFHRLWKNSLEDIGIKLFKLMLAVPPDDRFVKPLLDGKTVPVDFEMLENIDFAIEVIMAPGGASSTEERQSMLLGFVQNVTQHPLIMNDPQGLVLMFKFMAEAIKLSMPDMSAAMLEYANGLEQRANDPQMQAMMQQQQAPPVQGAQR